MTSPLYASSIVCLTEGMSEYVLYWVIHYHRRMGVYLNWTANGTWKQMRQTDTRDKKVGFLGIGELGSDAAGKAARLGLLTSQVGLGLRKRSMGSRPFMAPMVLSRF